MNKRICIAAMIMAAQCVSSAPAGISMIMNGSFEKNGIIEDISQDVPWRWCDVNVPQGKFSGWVYDDWSTYGDYSLTLATGVQQFVAGDIATVAQQVWLRDVKEIVFDLDLSSGWPAFFPWDPAKRTALAKIDNDIVWDSDDLPIVNGVYSGQITVSIGGYDANIPHNLSLAMRVNKNGWADMDYYARWDFVRFDTYCGGFGFMPADINRDCYVDMLDLEELARQWLADGPAEKYDLFRDEGNTVNFRDYAVFAQHWATNTDANNWPDDNCFVMEMSDADIDYNGIVNMADFAVIANDWGMKGPCIEGDIDISGEVDYKDIAVLKGDWLVKSWLYEPK